VASQLPSVVRTTEDKENEGSYGSWRREFRRKYAALLDATRENTKRSLQASVAAEGRQITCRKECTFCCHHYVSVSLAQGMVIVDHLYRNRDLLQQFLDRYEEWREKAEAISDEIDGIRNRALASSAPMAGVIKDTRPLSTRYFMTNIRCPFLVDGLCSIYPVRPLACSGHHSVSPPEWCAPDSQHKPEIRRMTPDDRDLLGMIQVADPWLTLFELALPTMVYRLLTEGSAAMTSVMHSQLVCDDRTGPDVQTGVAKQ
jgi:Fe-S-cluster containining protein